ncbi:unnamed protein product [Dovyalis caffra]|uniref:Uncharacterized protein n=1 Tax=Dovyalis caffra TaxID=77055 RepID=A0AAV1SUL3_9ROSI|nr:unnamed protein product [Dovyalis caffra]
MKALELRTPLPQYRQNSSPKLPISIFVPLKPAIIISGRLKIAQKKIINRPIQSICRASGVRVGSK